MFHSLYSIETSRVTASLHAPRGYLMSGNLPPQEPGSNYRLSKLTGSTSYYNNIREDIQKKCEYLGYPEFFYTFSNTDRWDVTLASSLSQDGYDIWHVRDEEKQLPGDVMLQTDENVYFAHLPGSNQANCPFSFHSNCHRVPVREVLSEEELKKLMDRNVYTNCRIFNARVRQLVDNVMTKT